MDKPGLSVSALLTLMVALGGEPAKFGFVSVKEGEEGEKGGFMGVKRGLQTKVLLAIWPKDKDDAYLDPPQDALSSLVRMPTRAALEEELRDQLVDKPGRNMRSRFQPFNHVYRRLARLDWLLDPKATPTEKEALAFLLERAQQLAATFFSGCV